jgi:hypothetical protein
MSPVVELIIPIRRLHLTLHRRPIMLSCNDDDQGLDSAKAIHAIENSS